MHMKLIRVEVLFVSNRKTKCFFKELAQSALKNPDLNFKCVFFFFLIYVFFTLVALEIFKIVQKIHVLELKVAKKSILMLKRQFFRFIQKKVKACCCKLI